VPELSLDHRTGGAALAVGYVLLVVALFRDPASGLATATGSVQGVGLFLVLPGVGLVSGVYGYLGAPLHTVVTLLTATYLAAVGVSLVLFLSGGVVLALLGLALFGLATVAIVGSLLSALAAIGLDGSVLP
jgi:hypothetical protein